MKNLYQFLILSTVVLLTISAMAADKVVVIPLNTSGNPATKLWGEGRVGVDATLYTTANGINIAKSNGTASWDGAAAACPKSSWVCTVAEASLLDKRSGLHDAISCDGSSGSLTTYTWVQDESSSLEGMTVYNFISGVVEVDSRTKCLYLPVWCCSNAN